MLIQILHETSDDLPAPSSDKVAVALVEDALAPITNSFRGTYPINVDEPVLPQKESMVWLFLASVYICLAPFLHSNQGALFRSRPLNPSSSIPTGAIMMLIPGLVLGALWIPSVPLILFSSIDWYLKALDESPLLTKSVTAGLIQFMGDYAAQCYEGKKNTKIFGSPDNHASDRRAHFWWPTKHYSMRRGLSLFVDGLVLSGPLMHYSYQWMEQVLPTGTGDWKAIVCHVLIDDYIIDNLYIALSFVFTGVSEGHGKDLSSIFRKDYWATMTASLCTNLVLVPVEYFCFGYLSIQFRTLFMNFVDLLWGAIISFMSHRSRRKEAAAVS